MTRRLPRVAHATSPAHLPPAGLPGLDAEWSRIVRTPAHGAASARDWHVLDNGDALAKVGAPVVGTVLCVHGNPTWSYLWRDVLAGATAQASAGGAAWRVVAVDQLDMGFSERTGALRRLATRVDDLGRLTDALNLEGPVVTLGHDWGGVVSLGWAVDHPSLVAGVMLLNTAVHQGAEARVPAPLRLALAPGMLGASTVSTRAFLETTLGLAAETLPDEVRRAYRAPYLAAARRGGIGGFVVDIPVPTGHPSEAELHRIAEGVRELDVPALFLWGARDPIFGDRYLNDLLDRLPQADVHRFEGAGHLVTEDADVAGSALAWLDGIVPTPPRSRGVDAAELLIGQSPSMQHAPTPFVPLWAAIDERSGSSEPALVELAPPVGAAPRTVSWRLLSRRVNELAAGLTWAGVRPGDRVSLLVPPGADLTAVLYACLRIGAVVVVADAGLGLAGLTRAVRGAWPDHVIGALPGLGAARALGWPGQRMSTIRLGPLARRALGVSHTLAELARHGASASATTLPATPGPNDPAAVLFTSGSTGPAKGVLYTHGRLSALRDALADQYDIGHGTGLVAGFAPFALLGPALGATTATPDMDVTAPATLTARAAAAAVEAVDGKVLFLSPAALANVVATAGELDAQTATSFDRVRTFLSAGAPIAEPLIAAASALFPNARAHTPYGMTEGLLLTDISLDGIREAGSGGPAGGVCVGVPAATARILIAPLDTDGAPTGPPTDEPQVTGEILVSAPHIAAGYDRLWITDSASRRDSRAGDRWHRTGDVGHLDERGRLWVEGRLQHVITTPLGVLTPVGPEQRIERVPGVRRAAVVGVGPSGTQQVVVIAEMQHPVRRPGLAPAPLAEAARATAGTPLAAVLLVPILPTDIRHNSKIDRTRLGRWADGVLRGDRMTAP